MIFIKSLCTEVWSFNIPFVTWSLITVHYEASYKVTLNASDTVDLICKTRLSVIWTTMIYFSGWNSNGWNQFDMARNKKTNRWPIFGKLIRNLQYHFYCQWFFFWNVMSDVKMNLCIISFFAYLMKKNTGKITESRTKQRTKQENSCTHCNCLWRTVQSLHQKSTRFVICQKVNSFYNMTGASLMIDDTLPKWLEFEFFFSFKSERHFQWSSKHEQT